ncbi:MAG: radical SAM protein [Candidatus Theseobacter exili]|nr:radical SAM protein [Candidatus Theseobacter exili]
MKTKIPSLVLADEEGMIHDHPDYCMTGRSGSNLVLPNSDELIPLPEGSRLFTMPGRLPVGWNQHTQNFECIEEYSSETGQKHSTVACFLPPAYTRTLLPAFEAEDNLILPLWAYCAVGWKDGQFYAAGLRVDACKRWDPDQFDDRNLPEKITNFKLVLQNNRLLMHLKRCATEYHCFAAKNLFYERWECPLPTSPSCNASCLGCLSLQPEDSCQASQDRIDFIPTPEEISEIATRHLQNAPFAIASFGQGCEGEPLLVANVIEKAIRLIRKNTSRGIIHLNTNGSYPDKVKKLADAGLNSIRISLNSPSKELYDLYYKPADYTFEDVLKTIKLSSDKKLFTALNLLVYPGLTDHIDEIKKLEELVLSGNIHMIQMRNLNIDPLIYEECIPLPSGEIMGIKSMITHLKKKFPELIIGYFNKPVEEIPTPLPKHKS